MPPPKSRKRRKVLEESNNTNTDLERQKLLDPVSIKNEKGESNINTIKENSFQQKNIEINLSIPYKSKEIPAVITHSNPEFVNGCWVVLTHGAGGDLNAPQLKALTSFLAAHNFTVLCFTCKGLNIKYRINVFLEVLKFILAEYNPQKFVIGGRSMGARAAVMLLSNSECLVDAILLEKIAGVVCLSYPLHPVHSTAELRDQPLVALRKPIFFLSGDLDEMCHKPLLEKVLKHLSIAYKVHWLNGYDHSAKSKQEYQEGVYLDAFRDILNWCNKNVNSLSL